MGEPILLDYREHTAIIKLNRPEALNAINEKLAKQMLTALRELSRDEGVRSIIVTGSEKAFSSGADLKESKTRTISSYRAYLNTMQCISETILAMPKPVLAAISGYAIGSGCEITLACDLRFAAPNAKFILPEAKVASSATNGTYRLLTKIIGLGRAKDMLLTGRTVEAEEALQIGLVNRIVEYSNLMDEVLATAETIGSYAQNSIKVIKEGFLKELDGLAFKDLLSFEVESCIEAVTDKEREERIKEFSERKGKNKGK